MYRLFELNFNLMKIIHSNRQTDNAVLYDVIGEILRHTPMEKTYVENN